MIEETGPPRETVTTGADSRNFRATGHGSLRSLAKTIVRSNWPLLGVLFAFAGTLLFVPTLSQVATTDDWGYSRSVEILLDEHRLEVFPVVAATSVFQVAWGALFAFWTDSVLGAVRVSTIVITTLGGIALYAICRQFGVSPTRSALGVAAYFFNPLAFVLAFTFMTDPHFTAVLMVAVACYLRGLIGESPSGAWTVAGSAAAAAAILTRQQGLLIPLSIVAFLLLSRRLCRDRTSALTLARVALIPCIAAIGYAVWLRWVNGVPEVQTEFASEMAGAGVSGSIRLLAYLTFFELMYLGFFLLPIIAIGLRPAIATTTRFRGRWWIVPAVVGATVLVGCLLLADTRRRMPYVPQFFGAGGLGPPDIRGSRPRLFDAGFFDLLTLVSALSIVAASLLIVRRFQDAGRTERSKAGLILCVAAGQVAGVIPPSFHYLNRGFSLDRYLLPLLPLGIVLTLWALNEHSRIVMPAGWSLVAVLALFSIAGTRDYLVYMSTAWDLADEATSRGISADKIEAGAAWDGYHLYTYGIDNGIDQARTRKGPWWVYFYGKASDSTYVVSGRPLQGYRVVKVRHYSSWLQDEPTQLYLSRRLGSTWPS